MQVDLSGGSFGIDHGQHDFSEPGNGSRVYRGIEEDPVRENLGNDVTIVGR
jgi:hypothetical protein